MKPQLHQPEISVQTKEKNLLQRNPKKLLLKIFIFPMLFFFFSRQIHAQGTWTPLTNIPTDLSGGLMLLLSDGTVICKTESGGTDGIGSLWNKLTPDIHGSYINGTWSSIAAMNNTRLYFS